MKNILLIILVLVPFIFQAQPTQWFYGAENHDLFQSAIQSIDGNIILLGSRSDGEQKIHLQKITPAGDLIWEKTYPLNNPDFEEFGHHILELSNGKFFVVGEAKYSNSTTYAIAMFLNAAGDLIWKEHYEDITGFYHSHYDGTNFYAVGWDNPPGSSSDGIVAQVSPGGTLINRLEINISIQNYIKRIYPTADGNYLLVGRANVIGHGYEGIFLTKISPTGDEFWQVTKHNYFQEDTPSPFETDRFQYPLGVEIMPDQSIWIANCVTQSEIGLFHFTSEGVFIEERIFGNELDQIIPFSLDQLEDGNWLITGSYKRFDDSINEQGFAFLLDNLFHPKWWQTYGPEQSKGRIFNGIQNPDGSFLFAGMSNQPSQSIDGNMDSWLIHTTSDGSLSPRTANIQVLLDTDADCSVSPADIPLNGWTTKIIGPLPNTPALISNQDGQSIFQTNDGDYIFDLQTPQNGLWSICNNFQEITLNSNNSSANITFLVQPQVPNCPHVDIQITQPDLVPCELSTFFINLNNTGTGLSESLIVEIKLPSTLEMVYASEDVDQSGNSLLIDIPPISSLATYRIEFEVILDCEVQYGSTHQVFANVSPENCNDTWVGPEFLLEATCDGDNIHFSMVNIGSGGSNVESKYQVYFNDILLLEDQVISLPENGIEEVISFPADGRTWRVELDQVPDYPFDKQISKVIENCGTEENGLHRIGFSDSYHNLDDHPQRTNFITSATSSVPNRVVEAWRGLGTYNFFNELRPVEFTARIRNPLSSSPEKVDFCFQFSQSIIPGSFRVLASNGPVEITHQSSNLFCATMEGLNQSNFVNQDLMIRFEVTPHSDLEPDLYGESFLMLECDAYVDNIGPIKLDLGFMNYTQTFPQTADPFYTYEKGIFQHGGRGYTFATKQAIAADGAIFMIGETPSFSDRTRLDGLLVKTDGDGFVLWQKAITLNQTGHVRLWGIVPLDDGGCLIGGSTRAYTSISTFSTEQYGFIARVDPQGQLLWHKILSPAGPGSNSHVTDMIPAGINSAFVIGTTYALDNPSNDDPFYMLIDQDENISWSHYEELSGSAFNPLVAKQLNDEEFIVIGKQFAAFQNDHIIQLIGTDGTFLAENFIEVESGFQFKDFTLANDGGLLLTGYTQWEYEPNDFVITPTFMKTQTNGIVDWVKKPLVGPFNIANAYVIDADPSGGYYVGGTIFYDTTNHWSDMLLMKIDDNADTLWTRNFGNENADFISDINLTPDGDIILCGFNQSRFPLANIYALQFRTDSKGIIPITTLTEEISDTVLKTLLFPNPASSSCTILLSPNPVKPVQGVLCDLNGRIIKSELSSQEGLMKFNLNMLPTGIYIIGFPGGEYPPAKLMVSH